MEIRKGTLVVVFDVEMWSGEVDFPPEKEDRLGVVQGVEDEGSYRVSTYDPVGLTAEQTVRRDDLFPLAQLTGPEETFGPPEVVLKGHLLEAILSLSRQIYALREALLSSRPSTQ